MKMLKCKNGDDWRLEEEMPEEEIIPLILASLTSSYCLLMKAAESRENLAVKFILNKQYKEPNEWKQTNREQSAHSIFHTQNIVTCSRYNNNNKPGHLQKSCPKAKHSKQRKHYSPQNSPENNGRKINTTWKGEKNSRNWCFKLMQGKTGNHW